MRKKILLLFFWMLFFFVFFFKFKFKSWLPCIGYCPQKFLLILNLTISTWPCVSCTLKKVICSVYTCTVAYTERHLIFNISCLKRKYFRSDKIRFTDIETKSRLLYFPEFLRGIVLCVHFFRRRKFSITNFKKRHNFGP